MLKLCNPPAPSPLPSSFPFIKEGEVDCVFEIFEKMEGSDFSHRQSFFFKKKRGGQMGISISILTNPFHCYLSFQCLLCVCLHIIQCNRGSCCKHITGHLDINLYGCVSLLAPECAMYVLCVISNPSSSKTPHCVRPQ